MIATAVALTSAVVSPHVTNERRHSAIGPFHSLPRTHLMELLKQLTCPALLQEAIEPNRPTILQSSSNPGHLILSSPVRAEPVAWRGTSYTLSTAFAAAVASGAAAADALGAPCPAGEEERHQCTVCVLPCQLEWRASEGVSRFDRCPAV